MERTVIKINGKLCNGCGNCVSGCHEGALQLIDGKAVMVSDLYCDGLGACIGECPVGAIALEKREAVAYDEAAVMKRLAPKGEAAILAHLKHLMDHNENEWARQGIEYVKEHKLYVDLSKIGITDSAPEVKSPPGKSEPQVNHEEKLQCGCPGSMAREIKKPFPLPFSVQAPTTPRQSELSHFPIQLHLVNPEAGFFRGANLLLAADCTAFASGEFHERFLKGKALTIACPKLDSNTEVYTGKLVQMIDVARIDTLTVLVMEVPCCTGLVRIVQQARERAARNIPVKVLVFSLNGEVESEEWI